MNKSDLEAALESAGIPAGVTIEVFDDDGQISASVSTGETGAFLDLDQTADAAAVACDLIEYANSAFQR